MIGIATPAVTVSFPRDGYLQELRVLGAWWCLGSSALEPLLLAQYAPARLAALREAGL
ncbi:MAG TPA: hypothetical protein VIW28_11530 [Gemmatimonadales bacterium]